MKVLTRNLIISILFLSATTILSAEKKDYPSQAVPWTNVSFNDGFWAQRQEINRTVTIPHCFKMYEETNQINSPSMHKAIEAAAYTLAINHDPGLEEYVTQWIDNILHELSSNKFEKTDQDISTFADFIWHKNLYTAGHFFEASVACYEGLENRKILEVAIRLADYLDTIYGPGKSYTPPEHQGVEVGLVQLYRATSNERYLKLAKFFLDQRGKTVDLFGRRMYGAYSQDHKPVTEQREAVGHAVRGIYMYMGMTDVSTLAGTEEYLGSLHHIWEDIVTKKTPLTGGLGARRRFEGFGDEYELPNFICWNETCAGIGNMMWNHRLSLLEQDAKYIDVLERTLYNGFLAGVSLGGDRFFYQNMLTSFGDYERSEWFGVPCCPPNVARLMASLGGYIYAKSGEDIYVNLFINSQTEIKTQNNTVKVNQDTQYPWEGTVEMSIDPERTGEFTVFVRIPGWTQNQPLPGDLYRYSNRDVQKVVLTVNGKPVSLQVEKGYAPIKRVWNQGDTIELKLPMPVRQVMAHEGVKAAEGRVALERGPVVYCVEQIDNEGNSLNLLIPDNTVFSSEFQKDLLNGVAILNGRVFALSRGYDGVSINKNEHNLTAVPYFTWANRGMGEMTVWPAREESRVKLPLLPTIASTSQISSSQSRPSGAPGIRNFKALTDQMEPLSSSDDSFSFFRLIPQEGDTGWLQYDFKKSAEVSSVAVYWMDDQRFCKLPESWRVLYKDGKTWKPVRHHGEYDVERDGFNQVSFDPIETSSLRIEIKPQQKFYFEHQIGPPDGNFIIADPVEWYEFGIIELEVE